MIPATSLNPEIIIVKMILCSERYHSHWIKVSTYKYSISIPVKSIKEIEVNSVDGLLTIISVGVVTVILLLLWSISIKWE